MEVISKHTQLVIYKCQIESKLKELENECDGMDANDLEIFYKERIFPLKDVLAEVERKIKLF